MEVGSRELLEQDRTEVVLSCFGLACGHYGNSILHDVTFDVFAGESIVVLGPNGVGKSSLLKTLCGELKPVAGTVSIFSHGDKRSRNISQFSPSEIARHIAVVPQEEPTPFAFTVRQIVTLGRLAFGSGIFDSKEDLNAADLAMRLAGCEELANRPVTELSSGEKQRVLIARALAQDAPLLLMDEPTSHLDPPHQVAVAKLVAELVKSGKSFLTAVHDLNLAPIMASRAILISDGAILLDGPVDDVLVSPLLEGAFQTRFEKIRTPSGRLVVIPQTA